MSHSLALVLVIAAVTVALRAAPFLLFGEKREPPAWLRDISRLLPFAIMGMLVVYCLRSVTPLAAPYGIPELLSCAVVVALHVWRRNTLVSIIGGTACYMLLIQLVF